MRRCAAIVRKNWRFPADGADQGSFQSETEGEVMTNTVKGSGSCLCGAVKIDAEAVKTDMHACHCGMCRKWSGGPFLAVDCGSAVTFTGEENISVYDSSPWAQRGFCGKCGTHLFYRAKEGPLYYMPVALFDELSGVTFEGQIFIDRKPDYYEFANKTQNMTEAEVFALFGQPA